MNLKQKKLVILITAAAFAFGFGPSANAMHIMEGYLPLGYCIFWGVLCFPFLAAGFFSIKNKLTENRKLLLILAMCGAYAFVLSALKIPSVTGSSSHMTGTGLGAILFGPGIMSILGAIVLLFQSLLLAHGGLTTLGANIFSMAIAGPCLSYGIYKLLTWKKISANQLEKKSSRYNSFVIFLAAFLGDIFTYFITSVQLGMAHPDPSSGIIGSVVKFLSLFAVTQIPLAIIEGILTVLIISSLATYASSELSFLGFLKGEKKYVK